MVFRIALKIIGQNIFLYFIYLFLYFIIKLIKIIFRLENIIIVCQVNKNLSLGAFL